MILTGAKHKGFAIICVQHLFDFSLKKSQAIARYRLSCCTDHLFLIPRQTPVGVPYL